MRDTAAQLALVLLAGLGFASSSWALGANPVCGPDRPCRHLCRLEAQAAFLACVDQGHARRECRPRAHALRRACLAAECGPQSRCEDGCEIRGQRLLWRCLAAGGDLEDCRADAATATKSCIEQCRGCVCPDVYEPVCGADGKTYENGCRAACVGTPVEHDGPCEPTCEPLACRIVCEFGFAKDAYGCPICECAPPRSCLRDTDCDEGLVCIGLCAADVCLPDAPDCCVGTCRPDPCSCSDLVERPVCGQDGVTYPNACFAGCAGVPVQREGACPTD